MEDFFGTIIFGILILLFIEVVGVITIMGLYFAMVIFLWMISGQFFISWNELIDTLMIALRFGIVAGLIAIPMLED